MKNQAFLDLLFENRNKAYGAYELRTSSDRILLKALTIGIATVCLGMGGVLYSFNRNPTIELPKQKERRVDVVISTIKEKEVDVVVPPVVPVTEEKRLQLNTKQVKEIIPTPSSEVKIEETIKNRKEIEDADLGANDRTSDLASTGQVGGGEVSDGKKNVTGNQNTQLTEGPKTVVVEKPFESTKTVTVRQASFMAVYPGCEKEKTKGNDALTKCMSDKISQQLGSELEGFAENASRSGTQQLVAKMQFVVDKNGEIAQIKPLSGSDKELGVESKRALDKINRTFQRRGIKIQPAQLEDGTAANLIFSIPVKFQLQ